MIGREHRMTTTDHRSRAVLARDAALARVRRTRRWVIVGAAALTAGIAALVSAVAPGRSLASKSAVRAGASTRASVSSTAIPKLPAPADPNSLGLGAASQQPQSVPPPPPPASAPQPAQAPPSSGGGAVVSGGS
jgi:hypothetical protein